MTSTSATDTHRRLPSQGNPAEKADVCTQCRRRKQRCDRGLPCSNCLRRAVPHLCRPAGQEPTQAYEHLSAKRPRYTSDAPLSASLGRIVDIPVQNVQQSTATGRLWNTRGGPTFHGDSYFGHQNAADMMQIESPQLPIGMTGIRVRDARNGSQRGTYRSEKAPYAHIWELLGYLPRQKAIVDRLVEAFLSELNPVFDGVHGETFMKKYNAFWDRKWGDDDAMSIDLRWLCLLFIVLAFGELLDCPIEASSSIRAECEETSLQFYWAARTSITLSATFWHESPDTVRASILISRYLIYHGRKTEGWLSSRFTISFAQAQGMHIDGESWRLPPKVLETRRRLWCTSHALEKYISLALGRPSCTTEATCMKMKIRNIWIDDMADSEAREAQEQHGEHPTQSVFFIFQQSLTTIMERMQNECFGLNPLPTSYSAYEKVLDLDQTLMRWATSLPSYFRLDNVDTSLDIACPYLYWQRMSLQSAFHFARVTLHRSYLLRDSLTDRFHLSYEACMSSACADLKLKLDIRYSSTADRLRAGLANHSLCGSALVLGIIAVRDPTSAKSGALLQDLEAYCEKQNADSWVNEFVLAEVRVIELCIASARRSRQDAGIVQTRTTFGNGASSASQISNPIPHTVHTQVPIQGTPPNIAYNHTSGAIVEGAASSLDESWLDSWFGPSRMFPDPGDYESWENLVGTLQALQ